MKHHADALTTPIRLALLHNMLTPTMAVTTATSQQGPVLVHNLNGGITWVSFDDFTTPDALRLLVTKVTRGGASVHQAQRALF